MTNPADEQAAHSGQDNAQHRRSRRSLPVQDWPAADRVAWQAARATGSSLFTGRGSASKLSAATAGNYAFGYGCWLQHLAEQGQLDPDEPPAARFTMERMDSFVVALQSRGAGNAAVAQMLRNLRAFMRHVVPQADLGWLTQPYGWSLQQALPSKPRTVKIENVRQGLLFAMAMSERGAAMEPGHERNRILRDAALAAVFLMTRLRKGELTALQLGNLQVRSHGSAVVRPARETDKTRVQLQDVLTPAVIRLLQLYLNEARGRFPRAQGSDRLWFGMKGPMTGEGVSRAWELFCEDCYGQRIGPHVARHWLTRAAAMHAPELAFDAAVMLGHGIDVAQRHYAEAGSLHAGLRHAERIDRLRKCRPSSAPSSAAPAPALGLDVLQAMRGSTYPSGQGRGPVLIKRRRLAEPG